jgi:adenylate cyclase
VADQKRPGPAELEAAGLYDPDAADAAERLALLEYFIDLGATLEELVATKPDEFGVLASAIALWGDRERLSLDEVAAASGADTELISRTWRAAGFPEPDPDPNVRVFTRPDVDIFTVLRAGVGLFGEDEIIQLIRVLGAATARVADAAVSSFFVNVAQQAIEQDASGLALSRANAESIALLDGMTQAFDTLLRHHLERGFRPITTDDSALGIDLVRRSVGFVDLVESTAWTQQLDMPALSRAMSIFDATASESVVNRGGRVVKLIGDGVMYTADDPVTATGIAFALIEAFDEHEALPPVRAGVATGEVIARDGDYSGAVVNLAARAVNVARPSTVLVDSETSDALADSTEFTFRIAGSFRLKGFDKRVPLFRVRRREST